MNAQAHRPIGVFDSGVGGLTVVREIHGVLPHEDLIYLGDTARVPYGTKSPDTVIRFAREDAQFLVRRHIKALVVACNTVSAWALPALEESLALPVFGVIEPGARVALEKTRNGRIGVLATATTIRSRAYEVAIHRLDAGVRVIPKACPLLVPLVEEGWLRHRVTQAVLQEYLRPVLRERIDTLILGCTHYPLLKPLFRRLVGPRVALVDSAECCARFVAAQLTSLGLLHPRPDRPGRLQSFVTDDPERFEAVAERFLGGPVEQAWKVDLPPVKQRD